MKRLLKDPVGDYERGLDELIKPEEEELFDSAEDVCNWIQKVIDYEDASNNSIQKSS